MVLWEKESASADACYIDLFPPNQQHSFMFEKFKSTYGNIQKNGMVSTVLREKGNELFRERSWTEAIGHYNKSIRFAINGSENLGLGYANRSSCFLHLKEYDKCLADIELAKKANYPQHLIHKLDDRKATCLKEMKESAELIEKVTPQLSFSPNTKFPGMADILEVRSNDEYGKHVVAKCDIDVGKIVLLEDVFAFGGNNDYKMFCKTCAKPNMNFIPCPNCADVMFCSAKCLESNSLHKKVCGALFNRQGRLTIDVESILNAVSSFENAESLMKFVECALATRDLDSPECESDSQLKYRLFLKLLTSDISPLKAEIFDTYKCLLEIPLIQRYFHSNREKRFLLHLIGQHLCILFKNGCAIHSDTGFDYMNKIGIYSSLFNHSCAPNILHLSHGNKMIAYVLRPVKKGEQLFINYFQARNNAPIGQKNLDFHCKCSKCVPCWKQKDRNRIKSNANCLFLARSNTDDLKDHKKRSIYKPKLQNVLAKFGRLPWSPEFGALEADYEKCCVEELTDWDY